MLQRDARGALAAGIALAGAVGVVLLVRALGLASAFIRARVTVRDFLA